MPEAISTEKLVTLPITSQELGRGGGLFCPPTKIGLSNSPTTTGLSSIMMMMMMMISSFQRAPSNNTCKTRIQEDATVHTTSIC